MFFARHDAVLVLGVLWLIVGGWRRMPVIIVLPLVLIGAYLLAGRDVYYLHLKMLAVWLALAWGWAMWYFTRRWPLAGEHGLAVVVVLTAAGLSSWFYLTEQARAAAVPELPAVAAAVTRLTLTGQPIYGDYTITPLVALAAGRLVFNNYADINPMYFQIGVFNYARRAEELVAARVPVVMTKNIISLDGRILSGQERVLPVTFFTRYCRPARVFALEHDYEDNALVIWQCTY